MLWMLSGLVGGDAPTDFPGLRRVLVAGAALCVAGLVALALTRRHAPRREAGTATS